MFRQSAPQRIEEIRLPPCAEFPDQTAGGARDGEAVFQGIADADGQAHPVGQHAPFAIRPAPQIEGADMQEMAARGLHPHHAAGEVRTARHHRRWQVPARD
jgi:hypothetical protein